MLRRVSTILLAALIAAPLAYSQSTRAMVPVTVQRKIALVIGNEKYPAAPLRNAVNDAEAVGALLRSTGFQTVSVYQNLKQRDFDRALDQFSTSLRTGDLAFFFYSGHGLQVNHENYLLPTDFEAMQESDVKYRAVSASMVRDRLESSGARLRVMILDACRDNPFRSTRGGAAGLSQLIPQAEGTIIAFATGDGKTADDNPSGKNGLFTAHLVRALATPGLSIEEAFKQTKEDVYRASNGRQIPFTYDNIVGRFSFVPGARVQMPERPNLQGKWRLDFRFERDTVKTAAQPQDWFSFDVDLRGDGETLAGDVRSAVVNGTLRLTNAGGLRYDGKFRLGWDRTDWTSFSVTFTGASAGTGIAVGAVQGDGSIQHYSVRWRRLQ